MLNEKFSLELSLKESRLHIVEGLLRAIDKIDAIIKKIRAAKDKSEAKSALMASPFKFSDKQAEAILEMRLRQLSNLDSSDLEGEGGSLRTRIEELKNLTQNDEKGVAVRRTYLVKEVTELGKKYGKGRKSPLIGEASAPGPIRTGKQTPRPTGTPKPRFIKVDMKKGVVEQVKGPRGALVLDSKDKVILMTEDGTLKKVSANFKGVISDSYSPVCLAKKETDVSQRKFLVVFEFEGQLKAFVLLGKDLSKTTSKGKRWLAEGAVLRHFSENSYTVDWVSSRKKSTKVDLTFKEGKPGSKGIKIGNLTDITQAGKS
jgi:DNA gyrase/topoisomerase IV subunit A